MNTQDLPTTWSALIAANKPDIPEWAADLLERCDEAKELLAEGSPVARTLLGVPSTLAQMAVVEGPDSIREIVQAWEPILGHAIGEIGETLSTNDRTMASVVLSFINVGSCTGVVFDSALDTATRRAEAEWPRQLTTMVYGMSDRERWLASLSALSANQPEHAITLAGADTIPASVTPGEVFDFNVQGFIRYMAAAEHLGVPLEQVLPAFENFIARFPYKLQAGMLRFDELLYSARVVLSRIGTMSEKETGVELHRIVTRMAL